MCASSTSLGLAFRQASLHAVHTCATAHVHLTLSGGALPPFYVFPTGLVYHSACCAAEVYELHPPGGAARARITGLMSRLARMKAGSQVAQVGLACLL